MKKKHIPILVAIAIAAGAIGWLIKPATHDHIQEPSGESSGIWTCSMHPQIRSNEPGDCPICGMDLIPLEVDNAGVSSDEVFLTESAMKLAQVRTEKVGTVQTSGGVRLSGKVKADERLKQSQTAHFPGRIQSLEVDFTGEYVKKGDVIGRIYSPELLVAQRELEEASKLRASQPELYDGARRKLRNWLIPESQIDAMENGTVDMDSFPLLANTSGYVTELKVRNGDYVNRGEVLFEITGLNRVWISLDVYENQVQLVSVGDTVTYEVRSLPGVEFSGLLDYIDPVFQGARRTVEARVVQANSDLRLKPEMIVSAVVKGHQRSEQLSVPAGAVLWTGDRSVVYIANPAQPGRFSLRNVQLGQRAGDRYEILEGLEAGEEIVVSGTFAVDAASQLASGPSMMSPERTSGYPVSSSTAGKLKDLLETYLAWEIALHNDDTEAAVSGYAQFNRIASGLQMSDFEGESHSVYMEAMPGLKLNGVADEESIAEMRTEFVGVSVAMIKLVEGIEFETGELHRLHCPMANSNAGADWISRTPEVMNPYFGSGMLRCGEVVAEM